MLDLSAAEARYHVRCYDKFRKVPIQTEKTNLLGDDYPLAKLVDEMNKNRNHNTWTSTELHAKYVSYGGMLQRRQMLSRLIEHFGEDIMVLRLDGYAPIIGFRETVNKIVKVEKLDNVEEENENTLLHTIITESMVISQSSDYDLGNFTTSKIKLHTSTALLIWW